jgi:DMSO/TMAO reductase YedYZ molybdopterin-dependent catalytic subunit
MSIDRRTWLRAVGVGLSGLVVSACNKLTQNQGVRETLRSAEGLNLKVQRTLQDRQALAREFTKADISPDFRANGSIGPADPDYRAFLANSFADWRLEIGGMVERPLSLSLAELRAAPARTQITRHDCVEGWSSIGEWTGARLGPLLDRAGLKREARYVVFHCMDTLDGTAAPGQGLYYESLDLVDAYHPQTILAYAMNGATLPVKHGAPLRLRVERQLGYKHAKYLRRIELVASLDGIGAGRGGFWEDRGYEWYAGI